MKSEHLQQSETYPKYHLIRRADGLHVALKAIPDVEGSDEGDGFFSVGQIHDAENFETACDNAEEEFRCMAAEFV